MSKHTFKVHSYYLDYTISGNTLLEAINAFQERLLALSVPDSEQVLEIRSITPRYNEGILGGKGGVEVDFECLASTAYDKVSPKYREFIKIYSAWIFAEKSDLNAETEEL